ncbi:MAG: DUF58 domain-containing protein [Chloroflexota bacterium]|nr:DUF58 domain-containing protein [Chloroflexota bacterium]
MIDGATVHRLERLGLRLNRDLRSGLMGEHRAVRRTAGIEFADYRPYTRGDDLRRVDWNAYARLGTLHIRQAQAEHDTALYLLVDASPSMDIGQPSKFLAARRLAAALGYVALTHLDAVRLAAPGAAVGCDLTLRGRTAAGALFHALQDLRPGQTATFDAVLAGWSARGSVGHLAILISDLLLDGYQAGVRRLVNAGFTVVVLHLLSPEELQPPSDGELALIDSETGARLDVRLGDESRAAYIRRVAEWLAECEAWCKGQGALYCRVQSDWATERVLRETLRRRGIVL